MEQKVFRSRVRAASSSWVCNESCTRECEVRFFFFSSIACYATCRILVCSRVYLSYMKSWKTIEGSARVQLDCGACVWVSPISNLDQTIKLLFLGVQCNANSLARCHMQLRTKTPDTASWRVGTWDAGNNSRWLERSQWPPYSSPPRFIFCWTILPEIQFAKHSPSWMCKSKTLILTLLNYNDSS